MDGSPILREQSALTTRVPWENPSFNKTELNLLQQVLEKNAGDSIIDSFESDLGEFIGNPRVVTVNNGTMALLVALLLIDIGPADKVISPTYTFASVVNPILMLGATPILTDSHPDSINLDLDAVETALEKHPEVRAILHVDVGGVPPDYDRLIYLAEQYNVTVIEDGAEALGSEYRGCRVGVLPHIVTLSFQTAKQLTCFEGGAVVLPNNEMYERCRLLRHHGMSSQYEHTAFGLNFRLSAMNAAVGLAQMKRLEGFLQHREKVMGIYRSRLNEVFKFQEAPENVTRVSWGMALVQANDQEKRDHAIATLSKAGVQTRINWKPVHQQPYHGKFLTGHFPVADHVFNTSFTLPLNNGMTLDDAEFVVKYARKAFA